MRKTKKIEVIEWQPEQDLAREMKNPAFKAAYDELDEEYAILRAMLEARKRSKLTQAQIAKRMGTTTSAISRMLGRKHQPRLDTVAAFIHANGFRIKKLMIEPLPQPEKSS